MPNTSSHPPPLPIHLSTHSNFLHLPSHLLALYLLLLCITSPSSSPTFHTPNHIQHHTPLHLSSPFFFFADSAFIGKNAIDDEVRSAIIHRMNELRSEEGASATMMQNVVWDPMIETYAFWAASSLCDGTGQIAHSPTVPSPG
eukprot:GHVQ01032062.1.p1 GENE.GHVQ01032062.1~~GHVQ01032062.1.p1  ORF type:complete len:143 (+),score=29.74 GHVQ01032062.1:182-610(+)